MMDMVRQPIQEDRTQQARRLATEMFRGEPDWVRFYREVLGGEGIIDKLFPSPELRGQFEKTPEFTEIQQMLAKLRERNRAQKQCDEPTRVITVRLPQSLHEALRHEAHNYKTSMNKLCISKLLQVIANELVPSDFERREDQEELDESPRLPRIVPSPSSFQGSAFSTPGPQHTAPQPAYAPRPISPPAMPGGTSF
jgi:predicted HicB family RNase H-like nuclease